ncbi:MAG TPA: hypothetical protein VGG61_07345 [Gemmataceae bacterium]|jgi:hypothetical protein
MTMPCRWRDGGLADFAGRVRFRRRFGYPGRIDDYERVWLTFDGIDGAADIRLNGRALSKMDKNAEQAEFEVTALLQARNELVVDVETTVDAGGLWGEVALEIRCSAYLRGVQVHQVAAGNMFRLEVNGEVVGKCERTLELYVIVGRSTVAYRTIEATPNGQAFQIFSEPFPGDPEKELPVRVDLVNGACTWFVVQGTCQYKRQTPSA